MSKIDTQNILSKINNEIMSSKSVIVVGKGRTAIHMNKKENDVFYIAIKQSLIFMKEILVDLLIITDFSGFYGIEDHLENVKYIICPYYLHDHSHKANSKYDWNFTLQFLKKHKFKGEVGFIQIHTDLNPNSKYHTYNVRNSGDLVFNYLNHNKYRKNIITFGIGIDTSYHPFYLEFIGKLNPDGHIQKKWLTTYKENIANEIGQMNDKEKYEKNKINVTQQKYKLLNIIFF